MLGGGGVRKDSFPPSPSNACHASYFLSAKRHKGSLLQSVLTILSPIVACKQALRLEIARVALARRLAVTIVFYRFVDAWGLFYCSRCDLQFILVGEHLELLTRVCRVSIVLKIGVPWLVGVTVLSTVEPKSYQ